jgi:hypothetical protein
MSSIYTYPHTIIYVVIMIDTGIVCIHCACIGILKRTKRLILYILYAMCFNVKRHTGIKRLRFHVHQPDGTSRLVR